MKNSLSPAWTMAAKHPNSQSPEPQVPGPGSYSTPVHPGKYSSIGQSKRPFIGVLGNTPGPGQYTIPSFIESPKSSQTKQQRPQKPKLDREVNPGPGAYHPQFPRQGPNYSMGNKTYSLPGKVHDIGPGSYNSPDLPKPLPVKFARSKRPTFHILRTPGPGSYNSLSPETHAPSFPKARAIETIHETPSPLKYNIPCFTDKKGGKSMSFRNSFLQKTWESPGPAAYKPKITMPQICASIGKSTRNTGFKSYNHLGPGQYEIKTAHKNTSPSFGKGRRFLKTPEKDIRQPLDTFNMLGDGPKAVILGRYEEKNKFTTPGPGQYTSEKQVVQANSPKPVFSTSKREEIEKNYVSVPGPGAYELSRKQEAPKWSFGKSIKQAFTNEADPEYSSSFNLHN